MTIEPPVEKELTASTMPLLLHLAELRRRLIYSVLALASAFPVYMLYAPQIYAFLVAPLAATMTHPEQQLVYTTLPEAFVTYIKMGLFTSFCVAFPFLGFQLWRFVAPGLYARERAMFRPFLIVSPLLFIAGCALAYYVVLPLAFQFFTSFETLLSTSTLALELNAKISQYLSLVIQIMFGFGISFQLPLVIVLLGRAGIVTVPMLRKGRRYALIIILIVAAIMTPPDVISQISLAAPLMLLYEISIIWLKAGFASTQQ